MMGNQVTVNYPPKQIVSLVPSQTELLYDLGLDEEVVGITKFCVHPDQWFRNKTRIGGTKTVNLEKIQSLQPDLIICNKEENTKEQIEELAKSYPVWVSDIKTVDEALTMIRSVGELVGKTEKANTLAGEIKNGFADLKHLVETHGYSKRVAYFIWRKPWMCAGGDTFINDMLSKAGLQNVLADQTRYPEVELVALANQHIDLILLSSEPYPFKQVHIDEIKLTLPYAEIRLIDGEMMSWYGSRMRLATTYLENMISGSANTSTK